MSILSTYLASPLPRRPRPALDRLVALLDEEPGLTRQTIARRLRVSYMAVVRLVERGVASGWIRAELERVDGGRSVWRYSLSPPGGGEGRGSSVEQRARSGQKNGVNRA